MKSIKEILNTDDGEVYIERLIGPIDVERLDGTTINDATMWRKEKIADVDDIESIYEREYVAEYRDEEIFLGNDKGKTITIKEKE